MRVLKSHCAIFQVRWKDKGSEWVLTLHNRLWLQALLPVHVVRCKPWPLQFFLFFFTPGVFIVLRCRPAHEVGSCKAYRSDLFAYDYMTQVRLCWIQILYAFVICFLYFRGKVENVVTSFHCSTVHSSQVVSVCQEGRNRGLPHARVLKPERRWFILVTHILWHIFANAHDVVKSP